ncbi:hypothetical protein [Lichenibacterium ramalinae]|uniref:hypothetical protein n=1 Tax=Lichenibacterium ramalinae TaxID=2316527 RepID=UPI0013EBA41B|nr:hypothetical protein [Lichenibacterium ramalinae]
MTDVLVFGDSHTAALRRGQSAIETDGRWPDGLRLDVRPLGGGHLATVPFFADRGSHADVTLPEYRRQFARLPREEDPEAMVYGVSALLHPVRVWRHSDWQGFAPADLAAPPADTAPVSSGTIRRLALDDQGPMLGLVALLRRLGRRVFAIEAPRPFRHHPALRRIPAEVVMRVDRIYRDAIRAELDGLGVAVVGVPDRCLDGDGFTLEALGQTADPHHGNEAYGTIMMTEVLAHLAGDVTRPPSAHHRGTENP